jgi:hypothetical protein
MALRRYRQPPVRSSSKAHARRRLFTVSDAAGINELISSIAPSRVRDRSRLFNPD